MNRLETKIGQIQTDLQIFSRKTPPHTGVSKSSPKTMMVPPRDSRTALTESSHKITADLDFLKTQVGNLQKVLVAASAKDESSKKEMENKILNGLKERFKKMTFISFNEIYLLIVFRKCTEKNYVHSNFCTIKI